MTTTNQQAIHEVFGKPEVLQKLISQTLEELQHPANSDLSFDAFADYFCIGINGRIAEHVATELLGADPAHHPGKTPWVGTGLLQDMIDGDAPHFPDSQVNEIFAQLALGDIPKAYDVFLESFKLQQGWRPAFTQDEWATYVGEVNERIKGPDEFTLIIANFESAVANHKLRQKLDTKLVRTGEVQLAKI